MNKDVEENNERNNFEKENLSLPAEDCYLTVACMKRFKEQFNDRCYELTLLRWFRDNIIPKVDVSHYYEIAPLIVKELEEDENVQEIYSRIYDEVVYYCVRQIENGNFASAYNRYKDSILYLEEQYVRPTLEERLVRVLNKITH